MRGDNIFFFIKEALLSRLPRRLVDVRCECLNFGPTGLEQLLIGLNKHQRNATTSATVRYEHRSSFFEPGTRPKMLYSSHRP